MKEEFISCLMNSPLVGESMRRLGCCDHTLHAKRSIPLEVTIMDPHREEEDQQFDDAINTQQSILLEVWDSDVVNKDFLGEAWLPPLATFGLRSKDIVLPLMKADFSEDAENGPSRDDNKDTGDEKQDPNKKITGELYVSVSWKYPIFEEQGGLDTDLLTWLQDLSGNEAVDLQKYQDAISANFGDLRSLAETMVNGEGVLNKDFYERANIEKKHRKFFDKYFKEHTVKESIKDRADVQEKLHTGKLRIKIDRARNLRRADAHKFRDCDAQVTVWVRNDVKNLWRKKPFMRTKVASNTRNPKWNFEEERLLLTGAYEARFKEPEEGWLAEVKKAIQTRRQRRHLEEDRAMQAVKRFGSSGLKIKFFDTQERPAGAAGVDKVEGENHNVEVFLGDSIREFKTKLAAACANESVYWKGARGEGCEEQGKYSDIVIGHKHLVMVFIPSAKVQRLFAQKLHTGEEYKRAYQEAWTDPSSWQPLDPARSFAQYPQYGFGRKQPQLLRVVEATEQYKVQNLRYKVWAEEMNRPVYSDTNDKEKCFGWAKYVHKNDHNSVEWRQSFLSKSADPRAAYRGKWIFEPARPGAQDGQLPSNVVIEEFVELDRTSVLLAPRCPKFDDEVHTDHRELLHQAKILRSSGKSDWEIENVLNKLLEDKWHEMQSKPETKKDESAKPPRITVDIIRAYLQRKEEQDAKVADGKATAATARGTIIMRN
jgi:hypothetical protein